MPFAAKSIFVFPVLLKSKGRISEDKLEVVFPGNGARWCFRSKWIENEGEKRNKKIELKFQLTVVF